MKCPLFIPKNLLIYKNTHKKGTSIFFFRIDGEAIGLLKMVELRSTTYPLTRID